MGRITPGAQSLPSWVIEEFMKIAWIAERSDPDDSYKLIALLGTLQKWASENSKPDYLIQIGVYAIGSERVLACLKLGALPPEFLNFPIAQFYSAAGVWEWVIGHQRIALTSLLDAEIRKLIEIRKWDIEIYELLYRLRLSKPSLRPIYDDIVTAWEETKVVMVHEIPDYLFYLHRGLSIPSLAIPDVVLRVRQLYSAV